MCTSCNAFVHTSYAVMRISRNPSFNKFPKFLGFSRFQGILGDYAIHAV